MVRNKLKSADGVCDTFEIVRLSVCEVIHRVCIPFVSCAPVFHVQYTIHERVAQVHIGRSHVNLCPEHHLPGLHLSRVHLFKEAEALFRRSISERGVRARCGGCAFLLRYGFCRLFIDVCPAVLYAPYGKVPQVLEIVRGIDQFSPFEAQPLYVVLDGFDIFRVFFLRIGVVHTQVADASKLLCHAKVHGYGFRMSYVQVAVRLWRETCLQASSVLAFFKVFLYYLFYEVKRLFLFFDR